MYKEKFELVRPHRRDYLTLRLLGLTVTESVKVMKLEEGSIRVWRSQDASLKTVEDNLEEARKELLPTLISGMVSVINAKAFYVLNDVIDKLREKGYANLEQYELTALLKCIEMGIKFKHNAPLGQDGEEPLAYEEMLIKRKRVIRGGKNEKKDISGDEKEEAKTISESC